MRVAFAVALLAISLAGAKSPINHETMWKLKRVGSPAVSPDGKWAVFAVTAPSYDAKETSTDLWIAATDGSGTPRQLTFDAGAEGGVAWSPDSRSIVFTAKRGGDESSQIYLLSLAGGEARRITNVAAGVAGPQFSPDGKMILFQSEVYPGAADEEANRRIATERKALKYNVRVYDGFPIRRWDRWLTDRRTHVLVQQVNGAARPRDLLAGTRLAAEPGFDGYSTDSGSTLHPVWTPDGQAVVFVASTNANAAAYTSKLTHIYRVALAGGEPKALTAGTSASYSHPRFSPDGSFLLARSEAEDGMVYHNEHLVRMEWPAGGAVKLLTEGWDRSVGDYEISADSKAVYLLAEDQGLTKVFSVASTGGAVRPAVDTKTGTYAGLSAARTAPVVAAGWGSAISPPEIVRIDPGSDHKALTKFNARALAELDLAPMEHFWFTSSKGRPIHNLLVRPPAFDPAKKYPLVVFIHGGAHNMSGDSFVLRWNYHLMAAPGYAILLTNYTGSTGFGEKFAQAIQGDPHKTPGEEINEAVDEALKRYPFLDASRMAAGGASYGGHLSNWLQATTTRFRCLYSHAGLVNLETQWGTSDGIYHREVNNGGPVWEQGPVWREQNPIRYAAKFQTPVLVTVGEQDFRVPLNNTIEYWSALQRRKIPSRLLVFPDENHWILKGENHRYFMGELQAWLAKYLGSGGGAATGGRR